jgi:hypothetical protein
MILKKMFCNINIFSLDKQIKTKLENMNKEELTTRLSRIQEIDKIITKFKKEMGDKYYEELLKYKKELENEINDSEKTNLIFYTRQSAPILSEFKEHLKTTVKINFMRKSVSNIVIDKKKNLIKDFLEVAKEYINLDSIEDTCLDKINNNCNCGGDDFDESDSYIKICKKCGEIIIVFGSLTSYKDYERVNISSRYTYDRKSLFRENVYQYQGKQNTTITSDI